MAGAADLHQFRQFAMISDACRMESAFPFKKGARKVPIRCLQLHLAQRASRTPPARHRLVLLVYVIFFKPRQVFFMPPSSWAATFLACFARISLRACSTSYVHGDTPTMESPSTEIQIFTDGSGTMTRSRPASAARRWMGSGCLGPLGFGTVTTYGRVPW